jgi:hypothetical protein
VVAENSVIVMYIRIIGQRIKGIVNRANRSSIFRQPDSSDNDIHTVQDNVTLSGYFVGCEIALGFISTSAFVRVQSDAMCYRERKDLPCL